MRAKFKLEDIDKMEATLTVRATIDSRYFTDNSLPYVTGCVRVVPIAVVRRVKATGCEVSHARSDL